MSLVVVGALADAAAQGVPIGLLVPAYFDPDDRPQDWARLITAAQSRRVPMTVILNPNSGPGLAFHTKFLNVDNALRQAGARVVGYVRTSYATRPLTDVYRDINTYLAWYPVDGFFIDEMTHDDAPGNEVYYNQIYRFIKNKSLKFCVIGNPGHTTTEGYAKNAVADVLIVYEDDLASYPGFKPPAWMANYPATRFGQIINAAPPQGLFLGLLGQQRSHAGLVYVTDDAGLVDGNAYGHLPAYWEQEFQFVSALLLQ